MPCDKASEGTPSSRLLVVMHHQVSKPACKIGGAAANSPSPSSIFDNEATNEGPCPILVPCSSHRCSKFTDFWTDERASCIDHHWGGQLLLLDQQPAGNANEWH
jgi:hypothetical protein